ncbi:hypothetical protein RJ639_012237 [Escallonia herrerae]|uniref:Cyanobacterial aminoacyl-tRNA synthetase CAAD domain-containing protein n=1 Tax=Escallonia herrerae TaxID=1293975 RepID=A0AA88S6E1_9ASTE|nr:hypothetical protein RJ639_026393 [Escallonia herrerae]KAK3012228.1 hypothetical protein RJ639_012237 [Escallonia herrerae]
MAATSSTPLSVSASSAFIDSAKAPRQPSQCVSLPTLPSPPMQSQSRTWKATAYCRKIASNVAAMATGEAPAEVATPELPEITKAIQEAWEKVEDKYAVTSLGVAGIIALWGSSGLISAIDRLPLVPGVLELVGIGYTGVSFSNFVMETAFKWFAYKNLVFKPDREALLKKIKDTYGEILGSS